MEKRRKDISTISPREFIFRFTRKNVTVSCTGLFGCDLSTDEGLTRVRGQVLTRTICPGHVRDAVDTLDEGLTSVTSGRSPPGKEW